MIPVSHIGPGKSFGELAVQKDQSKKFHKGKKRKASILCLTDCKFAVMNKKDY